MRIGWSQPIRESSTKQIFKEVQQAIFCELSFKSEKITGTLKADGQPLQTRGLVPDSVVKLR